MALADTKSPRRLASREARRQQLIESTIKCIARKGLGNTTLADVASQAGLSQGIVNLHFNSKDNLLAETLSYLAEEYNSHFEKVCKNSGADAASRLHALMELDLRPVICDPKKLAVWFAFWGEVKSVPTYQKICEAYDNRYDDVLVGLCDAIIAEGSYREITAQQVTDALSSMTDGLWLSCLIHPKAWDRHAAMAAIDSYLQGVFPKHFDPTKGSMV
jgi:TetR/AcrR family transcriptional repressor of bet genes